MLPLLLQLLQKRSASASTSTSTSAQQLLALMSDAPKPTPLFSDPLFVLPFSYFFMIMYNMYIRGTPSFTQIWPHQCYSMLPRTLSYISHPIKSFPLPPSPSSILPTYMHASPRSPRSVLPTSSKRDEFPFPAFLSIIICGRRWRKARKAHQESYAGTKPQSFLWSFHTPNRFPPLPPTTA